MSASQLIHLTGDDDNNTYQISHSSAVIYSSNSSALDHDKIIASSKVRVKPAVKFFWEYQYYTGKLICRHPFSSLIAYCINNKSCDGNEGASMVRIRNTQTTQRLLLKSFRDKVVTMAFSAIPVPILAVVDKSRTLHIFKILDAHDNGTLTAQTLLVFLSHHLQSESDYHTLSWCPWIGNCSPAVPVIDKIDSRFRRPRDPSMLLVVSCGNRAEVLDLTAASELFVAIPSTESSSEHVITCGQLFPDMKDNGFTYAITEEHADKITVSSLSRDASCLATSCLDGKVRIFSLCTESRGSDTFLIALHSFSPHDGLPVHGLIFLDSDVDGSGTKTWDYLITGSQYNRELRIWSCAKWSCVQTVRFCSGDPASQIRSGPSVARVTKPTLIIDIDWSKSLLVASDVTRRVLYVLTFTNQESGTFSSATEGSRGADVLRFATISEFVITMPCILFALGVCNKKRIPSSERPTDSEASSKPVESFNLEIHYIHTWHLLNGTISFEAPVLSSMDLPVSRSSDNRDPVHHPGSPALLPPPFVETLDELFTQVAQELPSLDVPSSDVESNACNPQTYGNSEEKSHLLLSSTHVTPSGVTDMDNCRSPSCHPDTPPIHVHEAQIIPLSDDQLCSPSSFPDVITQNSARISGNDANHNFVEDLSTKPPSSPAEVMEVVAIQQTESIEEAMLHHASSVAAPPVSDTFHGRDETGDPLYDKLNLLGALLPTALIEHPPDDLLDDTRMVFLSEPERNSLSCPPISQDFPLLPNLAEESSLRVTGELSAPPADLFSNFGEHSASDLLLRPTESAFHPPGFFDVPATTGKYSHLEVNWSTTSLCSSSSSVSGPVVQPSADSISLNLTAITPGGIETDRQCTPQPTSVDLLRSLIMQSEKHSQQMESVLLRLSETQNQLNSLKQSHDQLLDSLRSPAFDRQGHINSQSSVSLSSEIVSSGQSKSSSLQAYIAPKNKKASGSTDGSTVMHCGKQVLLQLRTQQGDFSKRFTQLESLVSRLSSNLSELVTQCKRMQTPIPAIPQSGPLLEQLQKQLFDRIRPLMKTEIENAFANHVPRLIEPVQNTVLLTVQECSKSLPSAMSDSVSHLLRDKNFSTQFSRTLSSSLAPNLSNAYRDTLQRCFIPALEKNLHRLFEELTLIFRAGTQQYLDEVEKRLHSTLDAGTVASTVCTQLASQLKDIISSNVIPLKTLAGSNETGAPSHSLEMTSPTRPTFGTAESVYVKQHLPKVPPSCTKITEAEETYSDGVTHSTVMRSGGPHEASQSPTSPPILKQSSTPSKSVPLTKKEEYARLSSQALALIREGRLVDALELALVSTNQKLVLDVCGDIEPDRLFSSGDSPIGQNILLSLIHQLSCGNLSDQLDLKLRYLHEAVLSLNTKNSTTIEHGPRIISLLSRRVDALLLSTESGSTKLTPSTRARLGQLNEAARNISESINPSR